MLKKDFYLSTAATPLSPRASEGRSRCGLVPVQPLQAANCSRDRFGEQSDMVSFDFFFIPSLLPSPFWSNSPNVSIRFGASLQLSPRSTTRHRMPVSAPVLMKPKALLSGGKKGLTGGAVYFYLPCKAALLLLSYGPSPVGRRKEEELSRLVCHFLENCLCFMLCVFLP